MSDVRSVTKHQFTDEYHFKLYYWYKEMSCNSSFLCNLCSFHNCIYIAMSSLTYYSVKYLFSWFIKIMQIRHIFTFIFSPLKLLNHIKPNMAGVTPFKNVSRQPCPPFKIAAITTNRNFFNCRLLLYFKGKLQSVEQLL